MNFFYIAAVEQNQDVGGSSDGGGEGEIVQLVIVKAPVTFHPFELSGVHERRSAMHRCRDRAHGECQHHNNGTKELHFLVSFSFSFSGFIVAFFFSFLKTIFNLLAT